MRREDFVGEQLELWRAMAAIVRDEGLSEITVEAEGVRVSLRAEDEAPQFIAALPHAPGAAQPLASQPVGEVAATPAPAQPASDLVPIVAPMVGVFYRAPSPDDPSFVEVGDRVEIGQQIGIIEAMKTFNDLQSEVEGTIVEVVAGNAELVEMGSTLFLVQSAKP